VSQDHHPSTERYIGIDWAAERMRSGCSSRPERRSPPSVEHIADGIAGLINKPKRIGDPADLPVPTGGWSTCCSRPATR
jgi:hypothetical protein